MVTLDDSFVCFIALAKKKCFKYALANIQRLFLHFFFNLNFFSAHICDTIVTLNQFSDLTYLMFSVYSDIYIYLDEHKYLIKTGNTLAIVG